MHSLSNDLLIVWGCAIVLDVFLFLALITDSYFSGGKVTKDMTVGCWSFAIVPVIAGILTVLLLLRIINLFFLY